MELEVSKIFHCVTGYALACELDSTGISNLKIDPVGRVVSIRWMLALKILGIVCYACFAVSNEVSWRSRAYKMNHIGDRLHTFRAQFVFRRTH